MRTIKSNITAKRQLPQHIRDSFPLFVEFLKSYYNFLDSPQQNSIVSLEQIRDIDTSLDQFISQFKKEFSENVPIDQASDPRQLIKYMKDFYLSRGSEASYKFLFKTIFNKDISIHYPSTQILKVSDGKWQQDISIFVSVQEGFPDLFELNGNFITISTTRNVNGRNITKRFTTFVNRVVQFASGTFELYIQRDYINEIDVGSTVSYEANNISYLGTVLPCPSKLTIFKQGKGFKVGQLFSLETQIGRGCLIKITKVGPEGEIKDIQLVRIGLDYLTTFYSYLSSKEVPPIEYFSPVSLQQQGMTPITGQPYNERLGGFTDYGFASKQTYFDYDPSIPVGSPDKASDRFFADPSYVGDLDTQFYAEDTTNPIDEDLAIIQVDLGPVAKYPGYYMSQDGFISDEMYIQDGNYYQAFSYVLRVDEELRRYADLMKRILHPAGLKFFSEYNITTQIKFTQVVQALKKVLDIVDSVDTLDQGFNFNEYVLDANSTYVPGPNAIKVFSRFGSPALFTSKRIADFPTTPDAQAKSFSKPLSSLVATPTDRVSKHVFKVLAHSVGVMDGGFSYDKYITSIVGGVPVVTPDPTANIIFSTKPTLFVSKRISDSVAQPDSTRKSSTKAISDLSSAIDQTSKTYAKILQDAVMLQDVIQVLRGFIISDMIAMSDSQSKVLQQTKTDTINIVSSGYLVLNPYDLETYSVPEDQYTANTPIT